MPFNISIEIPAILSSKIKALIVALPKFELGQKSSIGAETVRPSVVFVSFASLFSSLNSSSVFSLINV